MPSIKYSIKAPDSLKSIASTFKRKLKDKMKLKSAEKKKKPSDVVLVFFPIVSRTGTDIDAAISSIEDLNDKPVILVVLHHTFDPEAVVSDSKRFVKRDNTCTVDCLFYEDKGLLDCKRNDTAYKNTIDWLNSVKPILKERRAQQK